MTAQTGSGGNRMTPEASIGDYTVEPERSRIRIRMKHMFGLGTVLGSMKVSSGVISVTSPTSGEAKVAIDAMSFESGNRWRDKSVRSATFLDAGRAPRIEFDGWMANVPEGNGIVDGRLSFKGVTREVSLNVDAIVNHDRNLEVQAHVDLDRRDFGLNRLRGLVGTKATIIVELCAVQSDDS